MIRTGTPPAIIIPKRLLCRLILVESLTLLPFFALFNQRVLLLRRVPSRRIIPCTLLLLLPLLSARTLFALVHNFNRSYVHLVLPIIRKLHIVLDHEFEELSLFLRRELPEDKSPHICRGPLRHTAL
jgi:hypothetical protein